MTGALDVIDPFDCCSNRLGKSASLVSLFIQGCRINERVPEMQSLYRNAADQSFTGYGHGESRIEKIVPTRTMLVRQTSGQRVQTLYRNLCELNVGPVLVLGRLVSALRGCCYALLVL